MNSAGFLWLFAYPAARIVIPAQLFQVGYPVNYGNVKIMQWNQRYRKRDQSHPEPGSITRATTPSFWRGFTMMRPASTTLTGFAARADLLAHRATAQKAGA